MERETIRKIVREELSRVVQTPVDDITDEYPAFPAGTHIQRAQFRMKVIERTGARQITGKLTMSVGELVDHLVGQTS